MYFARVICTNIAFGIDLILCCLVEMKWVWFYGQVWKEFKKSRSEKSYGFTVIGYFLFLQKPKSLLFLLANSFQCDIPVSLSAKMHLHFFSWFFGTVLQGMRSDRTLQESFFFSLTHHVDHTDLNINLDGQFICLGFLRSICNCFLLGGNFRIFKSLAESFSKTG